MSGWVGKLAGFAADGTPAVLVGVATAAGSTPRPAGTRMVVTCDAAHGTIGGGALEHQAIHIARQLLTAGGAAARHVPMPLGPQLGQCCGGSVSLHFEAVVDAPAWLDLLRTSLAGSQVAVLVTDLESATPRRLVVTADEAAGHADLRASPVVTQARKILLGAAPAGLRDGLLFEPEHPDALRVALFGAGHVGRALATVLATMPCRLTWIDQRSDEFPELLPGSVEQVVADDPVDVIDELPSGTHILIMTHSHQLDLELVDGALRRGDFASLGLIGSATKRARFERRLRSRGFTDGQLSRLTCPIGVGGIADKAPGSIAVAVAAQILQRHEAAAATPAEEATA